MKTEQQQMKEEEDYNTHTSPPYYCDGGCGEKVGEGHDHDCERVCSDCKEEEEEQNIIYDCDGCGLNTPNDELWNLSGTSAESYESRTECLECYKLSQEEEEEEEEYEYCNCGIEKEPIFGEISYMVAGGGMMNGNAYATIELKDGLYYYCEYGNYPKRNCVGNKIVWSDEFYDKQNPYCSRNFNILDVEEEEEQKCWTCGDTDVKHKTYRDALDEYELTCNKCHRIEYPEEYEEEE
jgi:hypothetical protein|tara:strand:- start:222 stop:932 length:711 start_codon:yes stop_codon:yes gene_type:complete